MNSLRLFLFVLFAGLVFTGIGEVYAAPVDYDEAVDGDLDQGNPPTFDLDAGDNVWRGKIGPTPTSNTGDGFFVNLPAGASIIHIRWEYSPNDGDVSGFDMSGPQDAGPLGVIVSHQVSSSGDDITDSGFSTTDPILPATSTGQYKCEVTTGFAITQANWKITLTVERTVQVQSSTWGVIKDLYH